LKKILCLATLLVLPVSLINAQTPSAVPAPASTPASTAAVSPNLAGTWNLNLSKSDYDQVPAPSSEILTFTQTGSAFTVATASDNERGKEVYTLPFTTDGTETPTPKGTFSDTATLQYLSTKAEWKGASLVVTQKILYEAAPGTLKSTFTLSADGKTLTRAMHISVDQGEFDTAAVFEKQ
jgi:hypothetical protein